MKTIVRKATFLHLTKYDDDDTGHGDQDDDTINATKFSYDRLEVETTFTADVLKRDRASHFDVNGELTVNVMGKYEIVILYPGLTCLSIISWRHHRGGWDAVYQ